MARRLGKLCIAAACILVLGFFLYNGFMDADGQPRHQGWAQQ